MARIFLSFRHDDAAGHARRLGEALARHFGAANVFSDVDHVHAVQEFTEPVGVGVVESADVFLALIGPQWFERDASGRRRIDDPNDHVRREVAAALARNIRVIPILVGGAELPSAHDLPSELAWLAHRNPLEIRDANWEYDLDRLVRSLERLDAPTTGARVSTAARLRERFRRTNEPEPRHPPSRLPESAVPERTLTGMLLDAARAGVAPASALEVAGPIEGDISPREEAEYDVEYLPHEDDRHYSPDAPQGYSGADQTQHFGSRPQLGDERRLGRLLLLAVPLVLLSAGLIVAKWLLGWFLASVEAEESSGDMVVCTVFAPPSAAPGESILVQAFAHLPEQTDDAVAVARELDLDALRRTFQSLAAPVPVGGRLDFELRMPGLEVDDPVASLIWRRRAEAVQFGVRVPTGAREGAVIGTLEISLDSAPIGHIKFKLNVDRRAVQAESEPQGEDARRYSVAFISYASKDREKVLARVQMLSIIGVQYFQDLLSLEPGDRWEKKLELGIDKCDLFLLFWSSEAKRSPWVRREVRYALDRRGEDEIAPPEIRPVILEGPPIVEPWEELAHLHFNDRLRYFMRPADAS